jgi:EAL domain-containing protein (putative c-di-GMP-specific phosphodiesterase class I)
MAQAAASHFGLDVGRVLVVDDEPEPCRAAARVLRQAGYLVVVAQDGEEASRAVETGRVDVVVSDITMPRMDGIALLRYVHTRQPDVPVILITGCPAVETAVQALDHGAYKYLVKPVSPADLEAAVDRAMHLRHLARVRREAMLVSAGVDPAVRQDFATALEQLWVAFQPIVGPTGELFGHEALVRTRRSSFPDPGTLIDTAEKVDGVLELGRRVRRLSVEALLDDPSGGVLFLNLHPSELEDDDLFDPRTRLSAMAHRVVLEITERARVASIHNVRHRIADLRALGYRIALDDFGAGYAGLTSFALLEPEIVKIDMSLVRHVHAMPVKRRLIQSITSLCAEMGIVVVGEGVESRHERDTLVDLGCQLLQGYLFAEPGVGFRRYRW